MRNPAVAGRFYSADKAKLRKQIESCFLHELGPWRVPPKDKNKEERRIVAAVVPHAGYMYSGPVAAHAYLELAKYRPPGVIVILGPNHTGRGSGIAVSKETWRTPLGEVAVDNEVADALWKGSGIMDLDETAHEYEHSIEVQLPFLQYVYGDFKFVPICIALQDLATSIQVGECLSKLDDTLIIASSDFTHYESRDSAKAKDEKAIEMILACDTKGFLDIVYERNISICGFGPIAACLSAIKEKKPMGKLLKYATSGDVTGDHSQVVAYAAIVFGWG